MTTDHRLQDETVRSKIRKHAVGRGLSAFRRVQFRSPDVRRPPDTGQQAGRPAHRVVAWSGHLLVPCLRRAASDQRENHHDGEDEFSGHLHVDH